MGELRPRRGSSARKTSSVETLRPPGGRAVRREAVASPRRQRRLSELAVAAPAAVFIRGGSAGVLKGTSRRRR